MYFLDCLIEIDQYILLDDKPLHYGRLRLLSCLLLLQIPVMVVYLAMLFVGGVVGVLVRQALLSMT